MAIEKSWIACLYKLLLKYALPRSVLEKRKNILIRTAKEIFSLFVKPVTKFLILSLCFSRELYHDVAVKTT